MEMKTEDTFDARAVAARQRYDEAYQSGKRGAGIVSKDDEIIMRRHSEVCLMWKGLQEDRGRRYAGCTFDNYKITNDKQRKVVAKLRQYAADKSNFQNGVGVVLFGTKGAGKDHLLMALAYEVVKNYGVCAHWVNGVTLHADLKRDDFNNKDNSWDWGDVNSKPSKTPILWVSDPLPPSGALSEYQQRLLFQVIDDRYSQMLPTWLTMNVENGSEAEARMGAQNVDRLCHGALVIACDWESYREPLKDIHK
jgi:DNA replication protein DnaC